MVDDHFLYLASKHFAILLYTVESQRAVSFLNVAFRKIIELYCLGMKMMISKPNFDPSLPESLTTFWDSQ